MGMLTVLRNETRAILKAEGELAVYTPKGGAPLEVSVLGPVGFEVKTTDAAQGVRSVFYVHAEDVAPRKGDTIEVGGEVYTVGAEYGTEWSQSMGAGVWKVTVVRDEIPVMGSR